MEWLTTLALLVIWAVLVFEADLSAVEGHLHEAINQYKEVWKSHLYPLQVYADRAGYRTAYTTASHLNPEFVERAETGCNVLVELVAQAIQNHGTTPPPSAQHVDILEALRSIGVPHWTDPQFMLDVSQLSFEPACFPRLQAALNKLAHLGYATRRLEACQGLMVSIDTLVDNTCSLQSPLRELIGQHFALEVLFADLEGLTNGWRAITSRDLQTPPSTVEPALGERLVSILGLLDQIEATWGKLADNAKSLSLHPIVAEKLSLFAFGRDTHQPLIPSWWGAREANSARPPLEKLKNISSLPVKLSSPLQAILAVTVSKYQSMITYKDLMMMELLQRWAVSDAIPDLRQSVNLQNAMNHLPLALASLQHTEQTAMVAMQHLLAHLPNQNGHLVSQPDFADLEGAHSHIVAGLKTYENYCFAVVSLVNNLLALRGFRRDLLISKEGSGDGGEVESAIRYILKAAYTWEVLSTTLCQNVKCVVDAKLKYFVLERIWAANQFIVHAAGLRLSLGLPSAAISGRSLFLLDVSDVLSSIQPPPDSTCCKRPRLEQLEASDGRDGSPSPHRKKRALLGQHSE